MPRKAPTIEGPRAEPVGPPRPANRLPIVEVSCRRRRTRFRLRGPVRDRADRVTCVRRQLDGGPSPDGRQARSRRPLGGRSGCRRASRGSDLLVSDDGPGGAPRSTPVPGALTDTRPVPDGDRGGGPQFRGCVAAGSSSWPLRRPSAVGGSLGAPQLRLRRRRSPSGLTWSRKSLNFSTTSSVSSTSCSNSIEDSSIHVRRRRRSGRMCGPQACDRVPRDAKSTSIEDPFDRES